MWDHQPINDPAIPGAGLRELARHFPLRLVDDGTGERYCLVINNSLDNGARVGRVLAVQAFLELLLYVLSGHLMPGCLRLRRVRIVTNFLRRQLQRSEAAHRGYKTPCWKLLHGTPSFRGFYVCWMRLMAKIVGSPFISAEVQGLPFSLAVAFYRRKSV